MEIDLPTVVSTTAAAANFLKKPIEDVTSKIVLDGYEKLKKLLGKKSGESPEVIDAIANLEQKPESKGRADVLAEELVERRLEKDKEILAAVEALLKALPTGSHFQPIQVSINQRGRNNKALVAGRDIINTERHVRRVQFTPDERHITPEQGDRIRDLVEKLATRIAGEDGKPNFGQTYGRLNKKFKVGTYRELMKEDFDAAVSYLQQQGAINRSRLRRSNPQAYRDSLYAPIWAKSKQLEWEKPVLYAFAKEKLDLKKPIDTLKKLGPIQLKHLYEFMVRQ
jgi:hypothetical protein